MDSSRDANGEKIGLDVGQAEDYGAMLHERFDALPVPEIRHILELAELGQTANLVKTRLAKDMLEVALVVMRDHLEMREKNEPERWARETLGL